MRGRLFAIVALAVALAIGSAVWFATREDATRVGWRLTAEPDGAVIQLRAEFGGSSCSEFGEWDVNESASEVEIRATAHFEDRDCTADLVFEPHTITLKGPLEDRRLIGCMGEEANPDCLQIADP